MISIRAATEHDAVAISQVHLHSWRTTYAGILPDEYLATLNEAERILLWREWLSRDLQVYIADLDGEIAGSLLSKGFSSMIVWVLEKNPSRHFYVKSSAQLVTSKDIQIGGVMLSEVAYGWPDLEVIRSPP